MPYTPVLLPADLNTHMYQSIIEEITREDETLVTTAIDAAIAETKSFLSRFNLSALFGDPQADTAATITDQFRNLLVKDIAMWHLITLANPNISYESAKERYEAAIKTLTRIQKIQQTPDGWPLSDPGEVEIIQGNPVAYTSVPKRSNNW